MKTRQSFLLAAFLNHSKLKRKKCSKKLSRACISETMSTLIKKQQRVICLFLALDIFWPKIFLFNKVESNINQWLHFCHFWCQLFLIFLALGTVNCRLIFQFGKRRVPAKLIKHKKFRQSSIWQISFDIKVRNIFQQNV